MVFTPVVPMGGSSINTAPYCQNSDPVTASVTQNHESLSGGNRRFTGVFLTMAVLVSA
jgi:hypothetical protein